MSHKKPVTRRDFMSQSLLSMGGMIVMPSLYTMLASSRAYGATDPCAAAALSTKTPFICIDLAGGANIAGSNVIVGKAGGQMDFLTAYDKLGLPASMFPKVTGQVNTELGLAFHADSAMLRGIQSVTAATTRANVDGIVLCTVSNDDTGNNPTNPMYWIAKSGLMGTLTALAGTQNTVSGGNSTVPPTSINPASRPIRLASPADARSLVSLGQLNVLFTDKNKVDNIMGTIEKMSTSHLATFQQADLPSQILSLLGCTFTKSRATVMQGPDLYDPLLDATVTQVFPTIANSQSDQQVATVAKLVLDGVAGGGTIQKGGYDYHSGNRSDGETADFLAGVAIGQCLELAAKKGKDLMLYVFTDGGISSNGTLDASAAGRGKLAWTGDSGDRSASFMLMYKAGSKRPALRNTLRQIGYFSDAGQGVDTKSSLIATDINKQAMAVVLNYLALDGSEAKLGDVIGDTNPFTAVMDQYLLFNKQA
ncbi:MAG: hypothetical protein ACXWQO_06365 [Bdellovibrionota bacterium]